jgi:ABC-2 type transport system ATP-binding protein
VKQLDPTPLRIDNLRKTYGGPTEALGGVSFAMQPGEVFGFLGPNGAGKTTLISIVVTLEKATSGHAYVFGHEVRAGRQETKWFLGHVPQEIIVYGYFDVEEILNFYSGFYGLWNNKDRIKYLLDRLGLYEHRHKKVKQLSGGMKRRLLIAKSLLHSPKLLLLDEPTAGVDIELRSSLWTFVRELQKEGMSILLTTHYIEEAEQLCNRVAILQGGQIKIQGPTRDLVRDLTRREIVIFTKPRAGSIESSFLLRQTPEELVFSVPKQMALGDLLSQIHLETSAIRDVQIREGNLEDALRRVLGGRL